MKKLLTLALLLSTALAFAQTPAAQSAATPFRWTPAAKADSHKWHQLAPMAKKHANRRNIVIAPTATLPPSAASGFIDAPGGNTWIYTIDYDIDVLFQNEYYVDFSIKGFDLTVYDEHRQFVGRIKAPVEKPEGVGRFQSVQVGAVVTQKFFNYDNKYELMLMLNYNPETGYGARQETKVYSLTADGNSKQIASMPGYYISAVNTATDRWSENYYLLFMDNNTWDSADHTTTQFTLYRKASYNGSAAPLKQFDIEMKYTYSDGDNESMPVVMSGHDGQLYIATTLYEKTFFLNPFDFEDDTLSPDNHLLVNLYRAQGEKIDSVKTVSIAMEAPDEGYFMRSYCVGAFQGTGDLTFDFTTDGLPALITRVNQTDTNENSVAYFAVYNTDGQEIKRWGEDSNGFIEMTDADGCAKQYCFQMYSSKTQEYGYVMIDYPSLTEVAALPLEVQIEDGSWWQLSTDLDRTSYAGKYHYAVSFTNGDSDAAGNTIHRIAWFNADGTLDHVDAVNLGLNVARPMFYINGNALDAHLFNSDDQQEYLLYVQRYGEEGSSQTQMHLCVCRSDGEMLMDLPFDTSSSDINTALINTDSHPSLFYYYTDLADGLYHPTFVDLPFNQFEGEGTATSPYLLRTAGDVNRMRFNLNANFRLADDIDFAGAYLRPATGTFKGSLDGAGHKLLRPTIASKTMSVGMFTQLGEFSGAADAVPASVRNLTIVEPQLVIDATNGGSASYLAAESSAAVIDNVHIVRPTASTDETTDPTFGSLVGTASLQTKITNSSVSEADILIKGADCMGGICGSLRTEASITGCSFSGSLQGPSNMGGICGSTMANAGKITDCHVSADLTAKNSIGGIVYNSGRSQIARCFVEGNITATECGKGKSTETYTEYEMLNVGGICGVLDRDWTGTGTGMVIENCAVALTSLNIPADAPDEAVKSAHRIIGRSSANDEADVVAERYNPETGETEYTYGKPAPDEGAITHNYAVSSLSPIDSSVDAMLTTTEGQSVAAGDMDKQWFVSNCFFLFGDTLAEPWAWNTETLKPELYFESSLGETLGITSPRANNQTITLRGSLLTAAEGTLTVYNAAGAVVCRSASALDIAPLASGVYVARWTSPDGKLNQAVKFAK